MLPLAGGRGYCEGKVEWGAVPDIEMADVFVEMADTLVAESGRIDFLHGLTERCVQVLRVSTAGILFTDGRVWSRWWTRPRTASGCGSRSSCTGQGPCLDCFRPGRRVSVADLPSLSEIDNL